MRLAFLSRLPVGVVIAAVVFVLLLPYAIVVWLFVDGSIGFWWLVLLLVLITGILLIALIAFAVFGYGIWIVRILFDRNQQKYKKYIEENWENRFKALGLKVNASAVSRETPPLLYKYRSWGSWSTKRIIEHQEMHFSSPLSFNDPFDSRIPIRLDHLNEQELEQFIDDYIEVFAQGAQDDPREAIDSPYFFRPTSQAQLQTYYKGKIKLDPNNQEVFEESDLDRFGICCLSETRDDVLMWSHYTENHEGICIGFNSSRFYQELLDNRQAGAYHVLQFKNVRYAESFPSIKAGQHTSIGTDIFFSKAQNWNYEREWRILLHYYNHNKIHRAINFSKACMEEVYLGCKMKNREAVTNTLLGIYPHLRVYWAERANLSFKLDFERKH